jgi:hypothetical protein
MYTMSRSYEKLVAGHQTAALPLAGGASAIEDQTCPVCFIACVLKIVAYPCRVVRRYPITAPTLRAHHMVATINDSTSLRLFNFFSAIPAHFAQHLSGGRCDWINMELSNAIVCCAALWSP